MSKVPMKRSDTPSVLVWRVFFAEIHSRPDPEAQNRRLPAVDLQKRGEASAHRRGGANMRELS